MSNAADTRTWVVVGLGNPGAKYADTRHNVGFWVVEALARRAGGSWQEAKRFKGWVAPIHGPQGTRLHLLKPTTFMNLSGESVQPLLAYYQLGPEQLIVVSDDTALPVGRLRLRRGGSAGGHNGLKSIIQRLGGQDGFYRVRVGVGSPPPGQALEHYVLSPLAPTERPHQDDLAGAAADAVEQLITQGLEPAMNQWNGWTLSALAPPPPQAKPTKPETPPVGNVEI